MTERTTFLEACQQHEKLLLVGEVAVLRDALSTKILIPDQANSSMRTVGVGLCLWLRPDQRLLLLDAGSEAHRFRSSPGGAEFLILDAGARFVEYAVEGPDCCAALNAGCSLDFREAAFPVDTCAQSRFDRIPILLFRPARNRFEILVERPLASHFRVWMRQAVDNLQ